MLRPASRRALSNNKTKEFAMNQPLHQPPVKGTGHHPLMILAALAILLFCLVGTAAIMGWLPSSIGGNPARAQLSEADRAALAANMQQVPAQPEALPAQPLAQPYQVQPAPVPAPAHPLASQYPAQVPATQYAPQPIPDSAVAPAPIEAPAPRAALARPVHVASNDRDRADSNWCGTCGNIESIRTITTRARGSGVGAGAGAVLGGLLGNQIGSGNGRSLATVAGAVGGAVMGNQVEGNMKATTSYEIRVRLDDGTLRTFHQHSAPAWRSGDRVRIVKGSLRSA
jgi:outer membrane lipoprotein SlyB